MNFSVNFAVSFCILQSKIVLLFSFRFLFKYTNMLTYIHTYIVILWLVSCNCNVVVAASIGNYHNKRQNNRKNKTEEELQHNIGC